MPTYTYECQKCHRQLELVQKISEQKAPRCFEGSCTDEEMTTVITSSSFVLKGSGWAKDGYSKGRG